MGQDQYKGPIDLTIDNIAFLEDLYDWSINVDIWNSNHLYIFW